MITVNGQPTEFQGSVADLVAEQGVSRGVAVAVNGEVVARGAWGTRRIADGDHLEIVTAVQGG